MTSPRRPRALTDMALLHHELQGLFERLAEVERTTDLEPDVWSPLVDVFELPDRLTVLMEVPGVLPESLRVIVRGSALVISGERRERKPSAVTAFLCMERPRGRFTRTLPLEGALDLRRAAARLGAGLLTVDLPRVKDRRSHDTEIKVERDE